MTRALPPHNLEAERAVLGGLLIKPEAFGDVAATVQTDDFYLPAHREIYDSMAALVRRQSPLDPVTIGDELRSRGCLQRLEGGSGYLMDLAGGVPHSENVGHYAGLVAESSSLRRLIELGAELQSRAYGTNGRAMELIEEFTARAAKLVIQAPGDLCNAGTLVTGLLEELEARTQAGPENSINGVRTGVRALDVLTCGFDPSDLVVIAADPGGGKTALANQAALELAVLGEGTALICNLEMTKKQLLERSLVTLARLDSYDVRRGALSINDWRSLYEVGGKISDGRLFIEDKAYTLPQIITRARDWRMKFPQHKALLVVDYLQLIRASEAEKREHENRSRQIGQWCATLKELAKQLDVTVVVLSQFNRGPSDQKRAPTMRDLRESGEIEAHGDTIVLIHNPDRGEDADIDLILEKNRKGPCRTVRAHWLARFYEFVDHGDEPSQQQLPGAA